MKPSQSTPLQTSPIDRTVRTVGRILVGLLFVWAGIDKVQGWQGALAEVAGGGLPFPPFLLAATIVLQIAAGAAIMLGRWLRPSCWALAAFTALATVLYHGFWQAAGEARHNELITFMEHVCMVGGLLVLSTLHGGD
ncbi:DoxX family protein [Massilia sp. YIM B02763]|uniref:DoxX family protein n=1 Tax=Massilia sp. YIM B02763 TaxID=3050130 RepID=UPI0025B66F91|nr:DoxX family protein [Massilia sp. YIM B02763]MDN4051980.1 DoxX family protein [Massilia sp. YIM B02763]